MTSLIVSKWVDFLINLLAGVVGILIVLALERKRRPTLFMKVGIVASLPENDPLQRKQCRWPCVEVHNRKIPWWLNWVYDGDPALACRGWITFHSVVDLGRIFDEEMPARWNEASPPRLAPVVRPDGQAFTTLERVQYSIDIPTGECGNIALVYRAKDSESCYGWSNESYLHAFQHPSWKLDNGRYIARIRVVTNGREFADAFRIVNDAPFEHFRIEELDQGTKERLEIAYHPPRA